MAREDPQLKIRLPASVKDQVESAATRSGRSMNSEIVSRLEDSFAGGGDSALVLSQARQIWRMKAELLVAHAAMLTARKTMEDAGAHLFELELIDDALKLTLPYAQERREMDAEGVNAERARIGYKPVDVSIPSFKASEAYEQEIERQRHQRADLIKKTGGIDYPQLRGILGDDDYFLIKALSYDRSARQFHGVDAPSHVVAKIRAAGLLKD